MSAQIEAPITAARSKDVSEHTRTDGDQQPADNGGLPVPSDARSGLVEERPINPLDVAAPIVINLGKRRRKQIKQLERGEGPLPQEVLDVIEEVRAELGDDLTGKTLLPLVLVYRRKSGRRRSGFSAPFARRS